MLQSNGLSSETCKLFTKEEANSLHLQGTLYAPFTISISNLLYNLCLYGDRIDTPSVLGELPLECHATPTDTP